MADVRVVLVMDAETEHDLTSKELGCLIIFMALVAITLGLHLLLAEFLLAPVHCGDPECEVRLQQLRHLTIGTLAGMGCLGLASANKWPKPLFPLGAVILALTGVAGFGNSDAYLLIGFDFLVTLWAVAWMLVIWRDG